MHTAITLEAVYAAIREERLTGVCVPCPGGELVEREPCKHGPNLNPRAGWRPVWDRTADDGRKYRPGQATTQRDVEIVLALIAEKPRLQSTLVTHFIEELGRKKTSASASVSQALYFLDRVDLVFPGRSYGRDTAWIRSSDRNGGARAAARRRQDAGSL
jgi:hypothetical protein